MNWFFSCLFGGLNCPLNGVVFVLLMYVVQCIEKRHQNEPEQLYGTFRKWLDFGHKTNTIPAIDFGRKMIYIWTKNQLIFISFLVGSIDGHRLCHISLGLVSALTSFFSFLFFSFLLISTTVSIGLFCFMMLFWLNSFALK